MANADLLLTNLTNYRDTLRRQVSTMRQSYGEATTRWNNFNVVYEGVAADQFRMGWSNTCRRFDEYIDQTERILTILDEKILDLQALTKTETL